MIFTIIHTFTHTHYICTHTYTYTHTHKQMELKVTNYTVLANTLPILPSTAF